MPLSADIAASLTGPIMFVREGQSVTYREPHEDDKTITAIVGPVSKLESQDFNGGKSREDVREITILVDPDDATYGGVADPPLNAAFIVTSENTNVWSVSRIIRKAGSSILLECVRRIPIEVTKPNHRRNR